MGGTRAAHSVDVLTKTSASSPDAKIQRDWSPSLRRDCRARRLGGIFLRRRTRPRSDAPAEIRRRASRAATSALGGDLDRAADRKTERAVGAPLIDGDFGKAVRI